MSVLGKISPPAPGHMGGKGLKTINIGSVKLDHNVILAPMAGICNLAFRLLCKEEGAALVCSEFVNANGIVHGNRRTIDMLSVSESERPVSIQIFGSQIDVVTEAARRVEAAGADILDFNMGCPVPKVIKAEAGAALMRKPDHAQRLMAAVVAAVDIPVTVKMRAGWDDATINVLDLAPRMESVGVAALAIHGRTRAQARSGSANWDYIRQVKLAVDIPVIGNGDVFGPEDAAAMLHQTGCDGVMIGRGALGNPWIFGRTAAYLTSCELPPPPNTAQRLAMCLHHHDLLAELKTPGMAVREMRQHVPSYTKGLPGAARLRDTINHCDDPQRFIDIIREYGDRLESHHQAGRAPLPSKEPMVY